MGSACGSSCWCESLVPKPERIEARVLEAVRTVQGSQSDKYGLRPISDMDVSTWEVHSALPADSMIPIFSTELLPSNVRLLKCVNVALIQGFCKANLWGDQSKDIASIACIWEEYFTLHARTAWQMEYVSAVNCLCRGQQHPM